MPERPPEEGAHVIQQAVPTTASDGKCNIVIIAKKVCIATVTRTITTVAALRIKMTQAQLTPVPCSLEYRKLSCPGQARQMGFNLFGSTWCNTKSHPLLQRHNVIVSSPKMEQNRHLLAAPGTIQAKFHGDCSPPRSKCTFPTANLPT